MNSKLKNVSFEIKVFPRAWVENKIRIRGGRKEFDAASALTKNTFKYVEHSAEKVSKSFMESKVQTCLSFPAASDAYREVRL